MTHYLVRWEIDIDEADSPEDAVEQASAYLHGKDTTASMFEVLTPEAGSCDVCRSRSIALIDAETISHIEEEE